MKKIADWDGLRDHLRDVPWEDIFKLSASAAASEICECVQVGIDVYIPHCKYQVITNLDSSKVSGPDCIPVVVLKNCEPELSYILAKLFNKCLKECCFPDC